MKGSDHKDDQDQGPRGDSDPWLFGSPALKKEQATLTTRMATLIDAFIFDPAQQINSRNPLLRFLRSNYGQ
jgi:hypothetical protein